ncbi:MAG TPA: outer membrane beta-barrel protein [Verrucomicrobiae bacterium]|jgi:hypothetical protein
MRYRSPKKGGWELAPREIARGWPLAALALAAARMASGQDALRNFLTGETVTQNQSLQQQQMQQLSSQPYTIKSGDFRLLATPSMEVDWNDNVNAVNRNQQSDIILEPFLQLTGTYPLTQRNLLSLTLGAGYYEYLHYTSYSGVRLNSDSQLAFDVAVKDFKFNFHDRFSLTEDSSTEPGVAGTAVFGGFMNTVGVTTMWDLGDVILTLNYDHQNYLSTVSEFDYLNRSSELPVLRAAARLGPALTAGLEGSAGLTTYDQAVLNNNDSYSAGVFADWNKGSFFRVQPRFGYTIYDFDQTSRSDNVYVFGTHTQSTVVETKNLDAWYADLTLTHKASPAINYGFSAGHEVRLGIEADTIEDYYFRPNINWAAFKNVSLNFNFFYEHGNQGEGNVLGNIVEKYDWFGGGLTAAYPLMKRLTLNLICRFTRRLSDISTQEYTQNVVGLRLTYQLP